MLAWLVLLPDSILTFLGYNSVAFWHDRWVVRDIGGVFGYMAFNATMTVDKKWESELFMF